MKYTAKRKGLLLGLYDEGMNKFKSNIKGLKIRFAPAGREHFMFQFFVKDRAISPVLLSLENVGKLVIGRLPNGNMVSIDLENELVSVEFSKIRGKVAIGLENEVYLIGSDGKLKATEYKIDKETLGEDIRRNYKFSSLVGLKNKDGKCAIVDLETMQNITPFMFEEGGYEIVSFIDPTYTTADSGVFVIESKTEDTNKNNYLIVDEDGNKLVQTEAEEFLWQKKIEVENFENESGCYSYVALKTTENGEIKTKLIRMNLNKLSDAKEYDIDGSIKADNGNKPKFFKSKNGDMIFITEGKDGKGAVRISADGKLETLIENKSSYLEVKIENGEPEFIEYKKDGKFGKYSISGKTQNFEIEKNSFIRLASMFKRVKPAEGKENLTAKELSQKVDESSENLEKINGEYKSKNNSKEKQPNDEE